MDNDRTNISSLKNELNSLDREKESYFAQSKANKQKLSSIIGQIKKIKLERNALTDSVKKSKEARDQFNAQLKEKITAFKKLVPARKESAPKERVNVAFVRKEIEAMEYKIETEALPFNKEQQLMKIIKDKKKSIEGVEAVHSPEARTLSKEIDAIRAQADAAHKALKTNADESQKKHEEVISLLKQFKELQKKQKELDLKCNEYKAKVHESNEKLKGSLDEMIAHQKEHPQQHRREDNRERKESHGPRIDIAGMQHKAEEKLKKGHKLTTEDLLAFQQKK